MKNKEEKDDIKTKEIKKKELTKFIKTHIFKKTKLLALIGILLFIIIISVFMRASDGANTGLEIIEKTSLLNDIKERFVILLLILVAGWVPYFYIPAIAYLAYIFMLGGDIAVAMELHGRLLTLLLNIIPLALDILTVSIIAAIGIYMSNYTTKKYRYSQRTSFSFLDVKMHLYQITKNQEKYEHAIIKKQEKIDKMKSNDVKIDYANIFKIAPTIIIINIVMCIIQHLINN